MKLPGERGFSLLELVIVVAIVGIMASIALPALRESIAAQRVRSAASVLYDSLILARSEALKRNAPVKLVLTKGDLSGGWDVMLSDGKTSIRNQEELSGLTFAVNPEGDFEYSGLGRLTSGTTTLVTVSSSDVPQKWVVRAEGSGRVCVVHEGGSC